MAVEDKDFILRQVKQLARGLGMMLSKNTLKELINYEQSEAASLSDKEIEAIILMTDVESKAKRDNLSAKEIAGKVGITKDEWQELIQGSRLPTIMEVRILSDYLSN
ncbi:hypothetical protein FEW58_000680 [Enterococcus faecalis]|uniref:hypothetical protein n=1 Tax=Enterococcus TaxID=1350 RepID=UPI0008D68293|nr:MULTISPECIES: hypothetical protein [Enterococcus]EGO7946532.1 hypothetical protein [Enterococcus faecalis]EIY8110998.1 hypothetical protein [Enterococcus faecalis]EKQ3637164.1 hypothetical protein [Enterococcus faecalis]PQD43704.1 hypothetical protein CUM56_10695 [Enterococcus faecalis]SET62662.1 hypothetical protein SAMN04487821_11691 [Enterococcus malodoratus]